MDRDRETERDRCTHTDRQAHRQTHRHTGRHTETQRERERERTINVINSVPCSNPNVKLYFTNTRYTIALTDDNYSERFGKRLFTRTVL